MRASQTPSSRPRPYSPSCRSTHETNSRRITHIVLFSVAWMLRAGSQLPKTPYMGTLENSVKLKFAEFAFHDVWCIKKPGPDQ